VYPGSRYFLHGGVGRRWIVEGNVESAPPRADALWVSGAQSKSGPPRAVAWAWVCKTCSRTSRDRLSSSLLKKRETAKEKARSNYSATSDTACLPVVACSARRPRWRVRGRARGSDAGCPVVRDTNERQCTSDVKGSVGHLVSQRATRGSQLRTALSHAPQSHGIEHGRSSTEGGARSSTWALARPVRVNSEWRS
jgi:hypothetical protein